MARVSEDKAVDFQIRGRLTPSFQACALRAAVCPDDNLGCNNDVELISAASVGRYSVLEFRRPLAASDQCDSAINLGVRK